MILQIILSIASGLLDFLAINLTGSVVKLITNNSKVGGFSLNGLEWLGKDNKSLIVYFILVAAGIAVTRLLIVWNGGRLAASMGTNTANKLFESILFQDKAIFMKTNTSEYQSLLYTDLGRYVYLINQLLNMLPAATSIAFISYALYNTEADTFITAVLYLLAMFGLAYMISKKELISSGKLISANGILLNKLIKETLYDYKRIRLHGEESEILGLHKEIDWKMRKGQADVAVISMWPRTFIEIGSIAGVMIYLTKSVLSGDSESTEVVAAFVVAATRMLPALNQLYCAITNYRSIYPSIEKLSARLVSNEGHKKESYKGIELYGLDYLNEIGLNHIYFRYGEDRVILDGLSLKVKKGDRVAIMGESGAGKSTILDLMLGMTRPEKGEILYNNKDVWQDDQFRIRLRSCIGYVEQSPYFADKTVGQLISGASKAYKNEEIIWKVEMLIKKMGLESLFCDRDLIWQKTIGDVGCRLSGGQLQRIALAKVLYREPDFILLDEFTSALDLRTEYDILTMMLDIEYKPGIIIVSHRPACLNFVSRAYELKDKKLRAIKPTVGIND